MVKPETLKTRFALEVDTQLPDAPISYSRFVTAELFDEPEVTVMLAEPEPLSVAAAIEGAAGTFAMMSEEAEVATA